jgi:hypothetical protein
MVLNIINGNREKNGISKMTVKMLKDGRHP